MKRKWKRTDNAGNVEISNFVEANKIIHIGYGERYGIVVQQEDMLYPVLDVLGKPGYHKCNRVAYATSVDF